MRIQDMKKSIVKLIAASLIVSAAFGTASCGTHSAEPAEVNTKTESEILSAVEGEVHVAADGSDEAGSGTVDAPFATISYAAETMPGSQIIVHEGEYMPFELGPECSGSEGSPTVIRAAEGERVVISAENKVRYHAAAVFASNMVCGLMGEAENLLQSCGFSKEMAGEALKGLFADNAGGIAKNGPMAQLTGPVERNDTDTVRKHLASLSDDERFIYCGASEAVLRLAEKKHPDIDYTEMAKLLKGG